MATLHLQATTANQLNLPQADPTPSAAVDHTAKLAEFEKQLSDVCDFANHAVPMLTQVMQRTEAGLIELSEAHNKHVDDLAKQNMDMAVTIDKEFEKRDGQIADLLAHNETIIGNINASSSQMLASTVQRLSEKDTHIQMLAEKIDAHADAFDDLLDTHAVEVSKLQAELKAHRVAMYIGLFLVSLISFAALYKVLIS